MNFKKYFYMTIGFICLGLAYIGVVTPGIPFSIFLVIAAWAFAKSSKRWHDWLYNHKYFGPFLTGWVKYKVFPQYAKYSMLIVMASSLAILWHTTHNLNALLWSSGFMALVAIWAWRYPATKAIADKRIAEGKKVAWLK